VNSKKTVTTPADELRVLMAERGLTRQEIAALAGRAKVTIDSWLAPKDAKLYRAMQRRDLDLIRFRLGAEKRQAK